MIEQIDRVKFLNTEQFQDRNFKGVYHLFHFRLFNLYTLSSKLLDFTHIYTGKSIMKKTVCDTDDEVGLLLECVMEMT